MEVERLVLVPREAASPGIRRYGLARLGVSRVSALGEDRHERLERVAGFPTQGSAADPRPADRGSAPAAP